MTGHEHDQHVEAVLRDFDFHAVQRHMHAVGWTYCDGQGTPSIERLTVTGKHLLDELRDHGKGYWIRTGGFHAEIHEYASGPYYELSFVPFRSTSEDAGIPAESAGA